MTERKRKPKFSREELDILVTEVTQNEARLFGRETKRLSHADRDKIWEIIARKITSVSHVPRSVKDIKHRWDDMKRRTKDKLAFMRRSISSPSSPGRPSAIVLTAHERAIKSTLDSSRQMHGFQRADLDVVDSPSTSSDEGEEVAGPSQQHHSSSQRGSEETGHLSVPSFLHSSSLSDHSSILSQKEEIMYSNSCPAPSTGPPQPHVQNPPISGYDHQLFNSHIQQTELFRQFCQELVTIHRDVAKNMHTISQRMSDLSTQITQMCQILVKIKDELQTLNKGQIPNPSQEINLQRIGSKSLFEAKADISQNQPKGTPVTRITRSRKRKFYF